MTSVDLLAGVDLSTLRVDVVLIPIDPRVESPVLIRNFPLRAVAQAGDDDEMKAMRGLRVMRGVMRELLANAYGDVVELVIERPVGTHFKAAVPLNRILGAITAAVPAATNVHWMTAQQWRGELGARNQNSKPAGHDVVRPIAARMPIHQRLDEHELDALGLALAYRNLLDRHRTNDQED